MIQGGMESEHTFIGVERTGLDPDDSVQRETDVELSTFGELDLMEYYPLGFRYSIRKTIGWLSLFAVLFGVYQILSWLEILPNIFVFDQLVIAYASAALFTLKLCYWELYRRTLQIRVVGFRFLTSRGVILRTIGSQPFVPFNEVYESYDFFDILCGTRNVHYYTFMDPTQRTLRFEGLTPPQAKGMMRFLSTFLTKQIGMPGTNEKAVVNVPRLKQLMKLGAG